MPRFPKRFLARSFPGNSTCFLLILLLGLFAGCEARTSNLSPTPEEDPPRHARAVLDLEEARRATREAESEFFRRARMPVPEVEAEPDGTPEIHVEASSDLT